MLPPAQDGAMGISKVVKPAFRIFENRNYSDDLDTTKDENFVQHVLDAFFNKKTSWFRMVFVSE